MSVRLSVRPDGKFLLSYEEVQYRQTHFRVLQKVSWVGSGTECQSQDLLVQTPHQR